MVRGSFAIQEREVMTSLFLTREKAFGICPICDKGDESTRLFMRMTDGQLRCGACRVKESRAECGRCGVEARIAGHGERGPVCSACYERFEQPRRPCSSCGENRVIKNTELATCKKCTPCKEVTCDVCGDLKPHASRGMCGACYRAWLRHQSSA